MAERGMRLWSAQVAVVLSLVFLPPEGRAQHIADTLEPGTLAVCLPRNSGVMSGMRSTGGSGFDYRIAEAVADRLNLVLRPVWYEAELQEESDPLRDTYAMLSFGLCDVVPGHPRYVRAVGRPGFERARVPRWIGMPQEIDRDTSHIHDKPVGFVDVRPIAVTRGYMRSTIGLLYRDGTPEPGSHGDLGKRALAFQQGTLSGAIAMTQLGPADRQRARHFNPGASFLWMAEAEGLETAIVDVIAYDNYRKSNPGTKFRLADWRHPLGMDIGMALLEENETLRRAIDTALADILAAEEPARIASQEGLTYTPPTDDDLASTITLRDLTKGY
jgi:hypothetical protein